MKGSEIEVGGLYRVEHLGRFYKARVLETGLLEQRHGRSGSAATGVRVEFVGDQGKPGFLGEVKDGEIARIKSRNVERAWDLQLEEQAMEAERVEAHRVAVVQRCAALGLPLSRAKTVEERVAAKGTEAFWDTHVPGVIVGPSEVKVPRDVFEGILARLEQREHAVARLEGRIAAIEVPPRTGRAIAINGDDGSIRHQQRQGRLAGLFEAQGIIDPR